MNERITDFQIKTRERNEKIIERYKTMIAEGYMKSQALKILAEEFGFFSIPGVYRIVKNCLPEEKRNKKTPGRVGDK